MHFPRESPRERTRESTRWSTRRTRTAFAVGASGAVVLGVLLRVRSASPLWLDEAQSVAIARQPLHRLPGALREDGSPPLYYLVLHFWMKIVGDGTGAVRALSVLISVAAIGVAFLAGRAIADARVGRYAALLTATSPFAIRYATETRMYALLSLLAALEVLLIARAARRPTWPRLAAVSVTSGLLALTHYWALFLLAALVLVLIVQSVRGAFRATARRLLAGVLAGAVLFAPWLPSFVFQARHTGTPWAAPPSLSTMFTAVRSWGGVGRHIDAAEPIYAIVVALTVVAVAGHVDVPGRVVLGRPRDLVATLLCTTAFGSLLLGIAASRVQGSGFAMRYSAGAMSLVLLLVAIGAARLAPLVAAVVVGAAAVFGLVTSIDAPFTTMRTQAGHTAAAVESGARPGDLVVYCPDQLGPSLSRLLPPGIAQVTYPTLASPARVDWVDYAARNAAADPVRIATALSQRATGAIWLVRGDNYRTLGQQCTTVDTTLSLLRCGRTVVQTANTAYYERENLIRFGACNPSLG